MTPHTHTHTHTHSGWLLLLETTITHIHITHTHTHTQTHTYTHTHTHTHTYIYTLINRILLERLEKKASSSLAGSFFPREVHRLFQSTMTNWLKCVNVSYLSQRSEIFYDISLTVANLHSLPAALTAYFTPETLDGSNKYTPSPELGPQVR